METLDTANALVVNGVEQFRIHSFDGCRLVIVGGFDLCYYHDLELTFHEVESIQCDTSFWSPQFRYAGRGEERHRFEIYADEKLFGIEAESVTAVVGRVYYYERGTDLKDGERVAAWVKTQSEKGLGRFATDSTELGSGVQISELAPIDAQSTINAPGQL